MRWIARSLPRKLASLAVAIHVAVASVPGAFGQSREALSGVRAPIEAGASPLRRPMQIGLCQCVSDHSTRKLPCVPSPAKCEEKCGSHYAFVPLSRNALSTCPPDELYVVLPNADGRPGSGAISVSHGSRVTLLDQPYAGAELRNGEASTMVIPPAEVTSVFGRAIDARPILPRLYRLFFPLGSDRTTPESAKDIPAIVQDVKRRPAYEVEIIGYTDTLASEAQNQDLSVRRAQGVREALVNAGIERGAITLLIGRGEHNLLVPTAKNVGEPRNRRVEITVR